MLHCYNKAPSCWVWTEAKPPPPFSALWAARLLSTQSGKHLVLICKLFGFSNFWIISSHPAFWLTAKLLIFPERDVPWVGNLLGRSLSITAGTFTALLFLSIWIHWYWIWNTLKLKLKLTENVNILFTETQRTATWCTSSSCHTWYLSFFLHSHILNPGNFTLGKCVSLRQICPATLHTECKITHRV